MFKIGSFEDEIVKSMSDNLVNNSITRKSDIIKTAQLVQSTKISKAVDHLNQAAQLFDGCGFNQTSEIITKLLEKMANVEEQPSKEPAMFEFESLLKDKDIENDLSNQLIEIHPIITDKKGSIEDSNSIKGDKYTGNEKGLTPEEILKNLKHTGTTFNYGNSSSADDVPLVGVENNPDKNQMYIDKDRDFEDEE